MMKYPIRHKIPYEEIGNGIQILLLLRENKTWEALCGKFAHADPDELKTNTTTMMLLRKLFDMRDLGLISFKDGDKGEGNRPIGEIKETDLWSKVRVAFGGMSLSDAALLSRSSKGIAVVPIFGRPREPKKKIDVFVLMPFKSKMKDVYTNIKKLGKELGITITRADENFLAGPFMEKVWDGICAADIILADCTESNPNVFYEIGIAHAIGKRVVLITRSKKDIPSDITHFDYIPYNPEEVDSLIEQLKTFLETHLNENH